MVNRTNCLYYINIPFQGTNGYWNGWWDQPNEGTFENSNSGRAITSADYQPWYLGEPNGSDQENCGISWAALAAWNDEGCTKKLCGFCHLERAPVFTLRGMQCIVVQ